MRRKGKVWVWEWKNERRDVLVVGNKEMKKRKNGGHRVRMGDEINI